MDIRDIHNAHWAKWAKRSGEEMYFPFRLIIFVILLMAQLEPEEEVEGNE